MGNYLFKPCYCFIQGYTFTNYVQNCYCENLLKKKQLHVRVYSVYIN